ncbi:MAG: GTP 3',8-cyclase MoaA [Methylotenera sp.]|nr:GTP 3',8-cyclase MoaA [Oligoflexia bacterium]
MNLLVDDHGRRVRKLRLSLTDRCNLRCHYCMPLDSTFMSEERYLSTDECFEIVSQLCSFGLEELRLTGGEPLLRKSFGEIIEKLARLPLKKIGLTTNGILLDRHFESLKRNRVHHLNVSLDSLDEKTFAKITHGNHLKRVLKNIETARAEGFRIKINVVAMRGVNDHELFDFVDYSRNTGIEVRFLELMRIGFAREEQERQFISAQELIDRLKSETSLIPVARERDSTSFNYRTESGAQVGFIASESKAFCGQCSRWRLSADGIMRACLLKDDGLSIRGQSEAERASLYQTLLGMKPLLRPAEVAHPMNAIGG